MAITQDDLIIKEICSVASKYAVAVSFGFIEKSGDVFYSSQITINSDGKVIDIYRRVSPGWKEAKMYLLLKFIRKTIKGKRYDFIQRLWADANSHFNEVQQLAEKDEQGNLVGIWGAMSDFSRSFKPWENNFSEGLYFAGIECDDNVEAPEGGTKWSIPSYEYIYTECENGNTFSQVINYMNENDITLVGAVHDFICPETGKNYMFFPIRAI